MRRNALDWTVFDRWTGKAVTPGHRPQVGLPRIEAEYVAERLNRRRRGGDRSILQ